MLAGSSEISIMVHGMRNDSAGAASKVSIASERLAYLGYAHPVIGFSYDSDVVGAHLRRGYVRALGVARAIAEKNGFHLAAFLEDFARSHGTAVRLLGHSLGSEVIVSAVRHLRRGGHSPPIRSVHLFAASATRAEMASARHLLDEAVSDVIKNYYHEGDEELARGHDSGLNPYPAGLCGTGFDDEKFQNIPRQPGEPPVCQLCGRLGIVSLGIILHSGADRSAYAAFRLGMSMAWMRRLRYREG